MTTQQNVLPARHVVHYSGFTVEWHCWIVIAFGGMSENRQTKFACAWNFSSQIGATHTQLFKSINAPQNILGRSVVLLLKIYVAFEQNQGLNEKSVFSAWMPNGYNRLIALKSIERQLSLNSKLVDVCVVNSINWLG